MERGLWAAFRGRASVIIFPGTPLKLPIHYLRLVDLTMILHLRLRLDILIGLALKFKLILFDAGRRLHISPNVPLSTFTEVIMVIAYRI